VASFETLRWRDGKLELIDQRVLPGEVHYVSCDSAQAVANAIRNMTVRGAPAIGCAAAYGIALEATRVSGGGEFDASLQLAFRTLAESRPTAVNLFWSLERMRRKRDEHRAAAPADVADALLREAHLIRDEDVRLNRRMGEHGATLLADGMRVLTHCNAGALATAGYGTALGVIRGAVEQGKTVAVIADETRPFLQGARLTAWELMRDGIDTTVITDNMSGALMLGGQIDLVVVGADRIAANGDVANKIGTYALALASRHHGVPFYVAAPTSTLDPCTTAGDQIPIEHRPAGELLEPFGTANAAAFNPAFDVTPAALITGYITDRGLFVDPARLFASLTATSESLA
jgi:methylthioribose-1-phosphate isomerase